MTFQKILPSVQELIHIAGAVAHLAKPNDVILLKGDLGVGKTEFARAFIRALTGYPIDVPSPSFTLVQTYETSVGRISHFDFYRLENAEEVTELGLGEAFAEGVTLVEWPERLEKSYYPNPLEITLEILEPNDQRKITLTSSNESWIARLRTLEWKA